MVTIPAPRTAPAPIQSGIYGSGPGARTKPGGTQVPPYSNPNPRPSQIDYATPSIYQTNAPYKPNSVSQPGQTTPGPYSNPASPTSIAPITPQISQVTQTPAAPVQPLTANATGQFSLAAGTSPFNIAQNAQSPTTTGTAGKQPKPKPAPKKKAPAKHKASSLDKYLGKDSDYQNTVRDLTRALADFRARQGVEKTRAGTEYGYAQRTMGNQSKQDLSDIQNDAAARGIVTSGVYGQRVGDYNTTYNEQIAELGRQYKSQLDDFSSSLRDFARQQSLQKESARTAAIRRRSAKLGKVS